MVLGATVDVVATVVLGATVVVVVGATVVLGATVVVVVGATVVVVVVVVVGFATHWAYSVKSVVWLCATSVMISEPPDAAVNQPANV